LFQVKSEKDSIVAKPLDLDSAIFKNDLTRLFQILASKGRTCKDHSECQIKFCSAQCDKKRGVCTGRIAASNLMVGALKYFWSKLYWYVKKTVIIFTLCINILTECV